MIRRAEPSDLGAVLRIWLDANLDAHAFIPAEYWQGCRGLVQEMLPQAELYVHQDPAGWIDGFLGLEGNYVAGLFVRQDARSRGVGKELLDCAKAHRTQLSLSVYRKKRKGRRVLSAGGLCRPCGRRRCKHRRTGIYHGLESFGIKIQDS